MVVNVRAEAIITAKNRLRPGLVSAAGDLNRFRAQQTSGVAAFASTAARALGAVGGAYAAMSGASRALKSSISLEREMYNIQRATDTSGEALKRQESFILDLARATGKTKEELAQLYAAGGFAGRPARELQQFTEYASKATVAWGTNAQETGQALAEIGNIYEANQRRIEAIGDTVNTVADSSASSEKDLIEILRRVGGAGKLLGISAENMLAFGASLKEVGVGTEVVSTGLNAMLTKISVADDKFDEALKTVGLQPKKFRESVDKDATGSIMTLLKALSKLQGTKRIAVLKDMFGQEYADDISRLVGSLPRLNQLLGIANDKAKSLGSVRSGFGLALEKDFNKIDRATQAMDVLMLRVGNRLKEIGGGFAEVINTAVDESEKAGKRLKSVQDIDVAAGERAGKSQPQPAKPQDKRSQDQQALTDIATGKYDESSLPYVIAHAQNPEVQRAAEDEYRRRRFKAVDDKDNADEPRLRRLHRTLRDRNPLASPENLDQRRANSALGAAEEIRLRRMTREFGDAAIINVAKTEAAKAGVGLESHSRLGSFGAQPFTIKAGKRGKTWQPPQIDAPGYDGVPTVPFTLPVPAGPAFMAPPNMVPVADPIARSPKPPSMTMQPPAMPPIGKQARDAATVDLTSQGTQAGAQFVDALNSELDRGIAEAEAKIGRLKAMLSFTASPTIKVGVSGPLGGLNTGKGMTEVL